MNAYRLCAEIFHYIAAHIGRYHYHIHILGIEMPLRVFHRTYPDLFSVNKDEHMEFSAG